MRILRLCLFLGFLSISVLAQETTKDSTELNPCYQDASEKLQLIKEAEENRFYVRRIEMVGNERTRHRVFVKKMAFIEGDVFTFELLEKTIKNISKLKEIYPISLENVEIYIDRQNREMDFVFCVKERN
jgi:outer membrane protein assembly factor BamA